MPVRVERPGYFCARAAEGYVVEQLGDRVGIDRVGVDLAEQRRERDQRWAVRDLVHAGPHLRARGHVA
ncbi:MAG: hypothetical protein ACRDZV_02060 [Acidimicrobiia bacterium]